MQRALLMTGKGSVKRQKEDLEDFIDESRGNIFTKASKKLTDGIQQAVDVS